MHGLGLRLFPEASLRIVLVSACGLTHGQDWLALKVPPVIMTILPLKRNTLFAFMRPPSGQVSLAWRASDPAPRYPRAGSGAWRRRPTLLATCRCQASRVDRRRNVGRAMSGWPTHWHPRGHRALRRASPPACPARASPRSGSSNQRCSSMPK